MDAELRAALAAWDEATTVGRLGGGSRNEVWEIRCAGLRCAARRSSRSEAALDWELDLLEFLADHGFRVPAPVPAADGRRRVGRVTVQHWLHGRPPAAGDWPDVAAELTRLHRLTADRPQRPGFRSTTELLTHPRGGDVDLDAMPATAAAACRRAWHALAAVPTAVVHGDPGPGNIRVSDSGVGFLDWDEARVDRVDLDLADLPEPGLPPARLAAARDAVDAWEAACGWTAEPGHARRRLAALLDRRRM